MTVPEIISIISLTIAVIALFLNNKLSSDRDKRKEFKNRLDEVVLSIEDVEKLAVSFHCSSAFDDSLCDEIRWKVSRLSMRIQSIRYFDQDKVSEAYIELKKSISLKNFGVSSFSTQTRSSEIVRDIHHNSTSLIKLLLSIYDSKHKL